MKKSIQTFLGTFSLALFCLACSAGQAWAEEYTLTWDANSEPGVAGYKVHWGPESRHYTFQKDVGKQTSCTVTNLQDQTVYFFAVTAYDSSGQESDYSVEVAAVPRYMLFGIDESEQDGGWIEVLTPDYEHLHWLQTDWPEYISQGGEMRVVTGDIDGDHLDELIIGFGPVAGVSKGRFWVLDHDYTHLAWGQVDWAEYNAGNGETWPATGDLDGDGRDEILIGLGAGGDGRVYMFTLLDGALVSNGFFGVGWTEYRSLSGEVRPATGDL
ncbi:MAG: fibronectin type III domain-containing protein, partial [Desulfohalobiaceae bacterium]